MRITVLYFAAAREAADTSSEIVELPEGADVAALCERLSAAKPRLARILARCRVAIDEEFARPEDPLRDGATAAVIPPVAGGAGGPLCRIAEAAISLDEAVASVRGPEMGGIVTFTGLVRRQTKGREVVRLDYEAFGPMAVKKLNAIAGECAERWPGCRVAIVHRVGTLEVGELAVVIAAAAPHRAEAFAACRHAIERLKEDVPIWKREVFTDGTEWVGMGP